MVPEPRPTPRRLEPLSFLVLGIVFLAIGSAAAAIGILLWKEQPQIPAVPFILLSVVATLSLAVAGGWFFARGVQDSIKFINIVRRGIDCLGHVTDIKTRHIPRAGDQTYLTYSYRVPGRYDVLEGTSSSLSLRQLALWQSWDKINVRYDPLAPEYSTVDVSRKPDTDANHVDRPLDAKQSQAIHRITLSNGRGLLFLGLLLTLFGTIFCYRWFLDRLRQSSLQE